jgi:hypothetical protein
VADSRSLRSPAIGLVDAALLQSDATPRQQHTNIRPTPSQVRTQLDAPLHAASLHAEHHANVSVRSVAEPAVFVIAYNNSVHVMRNDAFSYGSIVPVVAIATERRYAVPC